MHDKKLSIYFAQALRMGCAPLINLIYLEQIVLQRVQSPSDHA